MKNKKKYSLSLEKKEEVLGLIKAYLQSCQSILFAYAHGSFMDDRLLFEDIDIAVFFYDHDIHDDILDLCLELSVHLSALVHLPVDVHALNDSHAGFCYEVTRDKLLLSRDEDISFDFTERTRLLYFDLKFLITDNLKDLLV